MLHSKTFAVSVVAIATQRHESLSICQQVHAHGGAMIELDGIFFWYGTSQKQPPGWLSTSINMYSSEDLATWQFEGEIFNWQAICDMPAGPPYRIERPKVRIEMPGAWQRILQLEYYASVIRLSFINP